MRRLVIMTFIGLFFINLTAQVNERTQIKQLPKFEVCESDDRDRNTCFKSEFVKLLKEYYLKEELAYDEAYKREFEAIVQVTRNGVFSIHDFSSAESRIFMPFVKAIAQFPKVKPALNPMERPVDLRFKIEVQLERVQIKAKSGVEIKIELNFTYDEETTEKYLIN